VYLSLADVNGLFKFADPPDKPGQKKRLIDIGSAMLVWLSSNFSDSREGVRMRAVEAWDRLSISATSRCSPDQVRRQEWTKARFRIFFVCFAYSSFFVGPSFYSR